MADTETKTLEDQIDEMIGDTTVVEEGEESQEEVSDDTGDMDGEVVEEEPVDEEVEEEEPEPELEPEPDEDIPEEGEVKEESEEEPGEDEEEGEDEIASFRAQVNAVAKAALEQGIELPAELLGVEEPEPAPAPTEAVVPAIQPMPMAPEPVAPPITNYDDFQILMDGVEFDNFMDNQDQFVDGMRGILQRHEAMLSQRFMSAIPNIVQNQVQQVAALQRASDEFYEVNEDLLPVRATVGAVATQVTNKNPGLSIAEVMTESAKITRKILRMPAPEVSKDRSTVRGKRKGTNPSFAKQKGKSSRTKVKTKTSKLQSQIDELLE